MAIHHHAGKRCGEQTRWGTGLTGVVVAAIAAAGLAWIAGITPGLGFGAPGRVAPHAIVAITATHTSGMRPIYPGGTGDAAVSIANHSGVTVRVTAVDLPADTTYAAGYTTSARTAPRPGCSAATSEVIWNGSTSVRGSVHQLARPLVIGAHRTAIVTLANGVLMKATAPAACEGTYFAMPALAGIAARIDPRAKPVTPTVDTWMHRAP
jgi:hypothetical protein